MKKNSNTPPTLEDLLSSIEHQGRDARRREQISAMLERMAAEESASRRHTVRLWTVRVAVAASVVGIIMTVARLMQPQPQPVGSQMAQAPSIVPPVLHSDSLLHLSETATVSPTQAPADLQPFSSHWPLRIPPICCIHKWLMPRKAKALWPRLPCLFIPCPRSFWPRPRWRLSPTGTSVHSNSRKYPSRL